MSYAKESYVTVRPEPDTWRLHPTFRTLQTYNQYAQGVVADFGCNHGALTILCTEFNTEMVVGFDMNIQALEVAAQTANSRRYMGKLSFVHTDLRKIPIQDAQFDFAYSFHTLEHIYPNDIDCVVSEFFRVLKPGAHMLIQIPYDHAYPDPCHVAFYKEYSLRYIFEKNGFITKEIFKDDRWVEKDLLTALFYKPSL